MMESTSDKTVAAVALVGVSVVVLGGVGLLLNRAGVFGAVQTQHPGFAVGVELKDKGEELQDAAGKLYREASFSPESYGRVRLKLDEATAAFRAAEQAFREAGAVEEADHCKHIAFITSSGSDECADHAARLRGEY